MGTQQLLLLIVIAVIIGLGVQTGLRMFDSYQQDANRDQMMLQVKNIVNYYETCAAKTRALGGGQGTYNGCSVPRKLLTTPAGTFTTIPIGNWVIVLGTGTVKGLDGRTNTRITALYINKALTMLVSN